MQAEDDETVNVAESAAADVSQKEKIQRDALSERARENLLQISQAPDVGPEVQALPSGKPGIDYAQQNMIRQLQTTLAPAFVLERLEKKPTPTSQTKSADLTEGYFAWRKASSSSRSPLRFLERMVSVAASRFRSGRLQW
jgi:hypothetical protein